MLSYRWGSAVRSLLSKPPPLAPSAKRNYYVQGQHYNDVREYFYYIDHNGMVYLDNARMKNFTTCFKEINFLKFFVNRITKNPTTRHPHFPWISKCGPEINYIRCEDTPVVFTKVIDDTESAESLLEYNNGRNLLTSDFQPADLVMHPETGRLYHPAKAKFGGFALVADKLAIEWTKDKRFEFPDTEESGDLYPQPSHFLWAGERHLLSNKLVKVLQNR